MITRALLVAVALGLSVQPLAAQSGGGDTKLGLDFELYRTTVEPILLSHRRGHARCVVCHSSGGGNSYLEPLAVGQRHLRRGAVIPQLRAGPASRRAGPAARQHLVDESAGGGGRRQPLARRRQALGLATRSRVADAGHVGQHDIGGARLRVLSRAGRADSVEPSPGARPLRGVPFERWRQQLPGAAAARQQHLRRGAVVPELRAGPAAGRAGQAVGEHLADESVDGRGRRQPLHAGGKHWTTQDAPEWRTLATWVRGRTDR